MKTMITLSIAALILVMVAASSFAGDKKNTPQTQAANTSQQISAKHVVIKFKAYQANQ